MHDCRSQAAQWLQDAGGYARGRPEHGNAIRFGEKRKAQLRREEVRDADCNGEPCRTNPRQRWVGASSEVNFLGWILRHMPPKNCYRQTACQFYQRRE